MTQRRKTCLSFSVSAAVAILLFASCTRTEPVVTEIRPGETTVSSTPPFQTKEPERYRATRTVTTITATGETLVTKNWIARNGEMRRDESEMAGQRVIYLSLPEGRFALLPEEKLFAELMAEQNNTATAAEDSETSPDRLLHIEPITTSYQRLGTETIAGRNTEKYRVAVNSSANASVSAGETLMWVDEALHMPIKSETKSANGTRVITELSDVELDVSKDAFTVPGDYKKIAFEELRKRLKLSQP